MVNVLETYENENIQTEFLWWIVSRVRRQSVYMMLVIASVQLLYTCSWIEDAGGVPGVCWTANSLKVTFATENKTRK